MIAINFDVIWLCYDSYYYDSYYYDSYYYDSYYYDSYYYDSYHYDPVYIDWHCTWRILVILMFLFFNVLFLFCIINKIFVEIDVLPMLHLY